MKKQGFTLIELMVVIVIMGILAAVAVPKLFGMIAKSKASEVPTAAGTWINMMDAYFQEKQGVADWNVIGYSAPGQGSSLSYASSVFTYTGTSGTADWNAAPIAKLNDCVGGTIGWKLLAATQGAISDGSIKMGIKDNGSLTNCKNLTASWDNLTRNTY